MPDFLKFLLFIIPPVIFEILDQAADLGDSPRRGIAPEHHIELTGEDEKSAKGAGFVLIWEAGETELWE
ncbi:MAG: hypothetical protein ACTHY7_09290 [Marinobacter sp.]|uniref:hypothetical protein n=1 Tax=Marinobacter sp. TaxID=50741 RepID=UPI003F9877B8